MDRQARKQLVMTRAAVERVELFADLERVRHAVGVPQLLRAAMGSAVGNSVLRSWFGDAAAHRGGAPSGWLPTALALLRRYRVATAALGVVAPLWRRRWARRLLAVGGLGAAGWFAARWLKGEHPR